MSELDREVERLFTRRPLPSRATRVSDALGKLEYFGMPLVYLEAPSKEPEINNDETEPKDLN